MLKFWLWVQVMGSPLSYTCSVPASGAAFPLPSQSKSQQVGQGVLQWTPWYLLLQKTEFLAELGLMSSVSHLAHEAAQDFQEHHSCPSCLRGELCWLSWLMGQLWCINPTLYLPCRVTKLEVIIWSQTVERCRVIHPDKCSSVNSDDGLMLT